MDFPTTIYYFVLAAGLMFGLAVSPLLLVRAAILSGSPEGFVPDCHCGSCPRHSK